MTIRLLVALSLLLGCHANATSVVEETPRSRIALQTELSKSMAAVWKVSFDGVHASMVPISCEENSIEDPTERFLIIALTARHFEVRIWSERKHLMTEPSDPPIENLPSYIKELEKIHNRVLATDIYGNTLKCIGTTSHNTEDAALLLFVSSKEVSTVCINFNEPFIGEDLYASGFGGGGENLWMSRGLYCGQGLSTVQITAGDSGGALLDANGQLVGILEATEIIYDQGSIRTLNHHVKSTMMFQVKDWLTNILLTTSR